MLEAEIRPGVLVAEVTHELLALLSVNFKGSLLDGVTVDKGWFATAFPGPTVFNELQTSCNSSSFIAYSSVMSRIA